MNKVRSVLRFSYYPPELDEESLLELELESELVLYTSSPSTAGGSGPSASGGTGAANGAQELHERTTVE